MGSLGLKHHPRNHINLKVIVRKLTLVLGKHQGFRLRVSFKGVTKTIPGLGGQSDQPGYGFQEMF